MMESVRMHLMAADNAMSAGNVSAALEQMNMARMQISVMGMKNMGVMNHSQAMQFMEGNPTSVKVVPKNCIILNDITWNVEIALLIAIRLLPNKNLCVRINDLYVDVFWYS